MVPQAPEEEGLDTIEVSPEYLELSKKCREALATEAQRCGKKLADRLVGTFSKMKQTLFQDRSIIMLNEATLLRASISFWEDILRIQAYHPINRAEKPKKAAYIFKWIAKMRPVKPVVNYTSSLTNAEMNANAMFAFLCACGYLKCRKDLPEDERRRILYSATYRDVHPDEWTIIFDYLERVYPATRQGINVP